MNEDFATIGKQVKAKSGAYQDLPDEVVGQAYLKKTNPLQYELYKNQVELSKTQSASDIQAQKELDVSRTKRQEDYEFEQANPKVSTAKEEAEIKEIKQKELEAEKGKNLTKSLVDELLGRDTGAVTGLRNPLKFLTGDAQYTKNLLKQLKSKLSLEGRQQLKGTGQISDFEAKMLEDSASALNTNLSNKDFVRELSKIKAILSGEIPNPEDPEKKNIVQTLLGGSLNYAKDIGAGAGMNLEKGTQDSFNATLEMAQKAEEKAKVTTDPEQKARLLAVAQSARETVGQSATQLESRFSENIEKPYAERSLDVASEIAALASVPGVVKSLPGLYKSGVGVVKSGVGVVKGAVSPKPPKYANEILNVGKNLSKEGGALRETVLSKAKDAGKKVDGTKIVRSIEDWATRAKRANPTQKSAIQKILDSAKKTYKGKKLNVDTAKNLWDDAGSGFTNAGKSGKTITQGYHRTVRDILRKQLDKVAPGFEKGTGMIREGIEKEKFFKGIRNSLNRKDVVEGLKETPSPVLKFIKGMLSSTGKQVAGGAVAGAVGGNILSRLVGK